MPLLSLRHVAGFIAGSILAVSYFWYGLWALVLAFAALLLLMSYVDRHPSQVVNVASKVDMHRLPPLLSLPATDLACLLRRKAVTSEHLTKLYIQHLMTVNPELNAVVNTRFDQALREARQCDKVLDEWDPEEDGPLPLFFGVPCTSKECFALEGFPHTAGLDTRKTTVASQSASVVQRMQDAGLVIMGTTNVPELCMWYETYNIIYGRTNNPYDFARTPGGSSGGEGAIIAACGSVMGLGSDVGGSIRMPAFFNGIFGHKPTGGYVPNSGQYPHSPGDLNRYCQPGPLCRFAQDLWPFLNVLAGPDGEPLSHTSVSPLWRFAGCEHLHPNRVAIEHVTVYVCSNPPTQSLGVSAPEPEVQAALRRAGELLEAGGATVIYLDDVASDEHSATDGEDEQPSQEFDAEQQERLAMAGVRAYKGPLSRWISHAFDIWACALDAENGASFGELMSAGRSTSMLWELCKSLVGKSEFTFPAIALALTEYLQKLAPDRVPHYLKEGRQLREGLNWLLTRHETGPTVPKHPSLPAIVSNPLSAENSETDARATPAADEVPASPEAKKSKPRKSSIKKNRPRSARSRSRSTARSSTPGNKSSGGDGVVSALTEESRVWSLNEYLWATNQYDEYSTAYDQISSEAEEWKISDRKSSGSRRRSKHSKDNADGDVEAPLGGAVLLYPTHPKLAPVHDWPLLRPFNFVYTGLFNALQLPATAVPMGLAGRFALPTGLQVVGAQHRDYLTVAVAKYLAVQTGGWKAPVKPELLQYRSKRE